MKSSLDEASARPGNRDEENANNGEKMADLSMLFGSQLVSICLSNCS